MVTEKSSGRGTSPIFGLIEDGGIECGSCASKGSSGLDSTWAAQPSGLCCFRAIDRMRERCTHALELHSSPRDVPVSV